MNRDDQEELDMEEEDGGRALVGKMLQEEVGAKFISVLGESGSGKCTLVNHFCSKMLASDRKNMGKTRTDCPEFLSGIACRPIPARRIS
jgi:ABC-type lipoprotein export system ATPase subunit